MVDVVEPNHLAVRGIEKGHMETAEIERAVGHPAGIAFGLGQDILRPQNDLLGLHDTDWLAGQDQCVDGGPPLISIRLNWTAGIQRRAAGK